MKKEYKFNFINIFRHLHTINKHRFFVFKLSIKAGIPLQGLVHDLSKYGFTIVNWERFDLYDSLQKERIIRDCIM